MTQWGDEWEMRILVLASLCAQYFLVLFAGVRKFHIPPWMRFSFRLTHIGSDALAIFALATLVNRQKNGPASSHGLEMLWAPILVMHLGGQVVITTYKIEDNEQWRRQMLTSVSKVTVAMYVLNKPLSTSNDKRLMYATVLLFVVVFHRCFQKSFDLRSSSYNALRKANSTSMVRSVIDGNHVREEERLEYFIQEVKLMTLCDDEPVTREDLRGLSWQLVLDFPSSYSYRLGMVRSFWFLEKVDAYSAIEGALSAMTSFLYTKDDTETLNRAYGYDPETSVFYPRIDLFGYAVLIAAICVVHTSRHKQDYSGEDNEVTLVLLYGTLLLELVYLWVQSAFRDKFSGRILQHNLIAYFAYNRRHNILRIIARKLHCKDLFDGFCHMEPSYSCKEITEIVGCHVKTRWTEYIMDAYSYRMFNNTRGELTLEWNTCLGQLGWSLKRPFDESIVLWHLATDFCFHHTDHTSRPDDHVSARQCREMSNYMVHLLFDNPEMLMPGSRKSLLELAYEELEVLLDGEPTLRDEKEFTQRLFKKCELAASSRQETASLVGDAWELGQSLLSLHDEAKIWELIQGVWVEMLCFSAGRCRGYLHAEALGTGGEYLSYVWLLLGYTGMETFPEKLQSREGQSFDSHESLSFRTARDRKNAATPLASQSEGNVDIVLEP